MIAVATVTAVETATARVIAVIAALANRAAAVTAAYALIVTALLYLAGRLPTLPDYEKVRNAQGREMRGTGLVVVVVVVCKHELTNK